MLPNVSCNHLAMLGRRIVEDPLDKVVAVLVARDVNQGDPSSVSAAFADPIQISAQEISTADLEALLDNLRGELISAILGSIPNDVVDGPASVRRSAVLANVLDAPVSELAMRHNIDVGQHLLDARALSNRMSALQFEKRAGASYLVFL